MSSPIIWIILPLIIAIFSFFFRRWKYPVTIILTLFTTLLAFLAWQIQIGESITISSWIFTVSDNFEFAGRQFVLQNSDRQILILIYLMLPLFLSGSLFLRVNLSFASLVLAMSATLLAALSVRPILYAALFIEIAVLIGIPMILPPGEKAKDGLLGYLTFLSIGFPLLLMGSGLVSRNAVNDTNSTTLLPDLVILGIGFAFLLAIFPLNTWIPKLFEQSYPYPSVFVLLIFPAIIITLLLRFVGLFPRFLDFDLIQIAGVLMAFTGGLWASFQQDLGRILGYAIIIEIGYSLLAITLPQGLILFQSLLIIRIITYGVWGIGLSLISNHVGDLSFHSVRGVGRKMPIVVTGTLVANFSLSGLPLLASFPFLLVIWSQIAEESIILSTAVFLSSMGLLVGGLRTLYVVIQETKDLEKQNDNTGWASKAVIILGVICLILAGLLPQSLQFFVN